MGTSSCDTQTHAHSPTTACSFSFRIVYFVLLFVCFAFKVCNSAAHSEWYTNALASSHYVESVAALPNAYIHTFRQHEYAAASPTAAAALAGIHRTVRPIRNSWEKKNCCFVCFTVVFCEQLPIVCRRRSTKRLYYYYYCFCFVFLFIIFIFVFQEAEDLKKIKKIVNFRSVRERNKRKKK